MALDAGSSTFATELDVTLLAKLLGCLTGGLEPLAGIELFGVLEHELAHSSGHGHADVGVDVDFTHTKRNSALHLFHRHAPSLGHLAAILVDGCQQVLGYGAGAVHHQMGVGDTGVDFLDAFNRQDVASRLAGELVSAVAGANGNGQGVQLGPLDELSGLFRVCQKLFAGHDSIGPVAVFLVALHGLQGAEAAQLTFHRHAQLVGHVDHLAGDFNVVLKTGDRFAVSLQGAVHHYGAEAQVDGALAYRRALSMVLVHDDGDGGVAFHRGLNQVLEKVLTGVFAGAGAGLHDHGSAGFFGRLHDGLNLLQVVDVERRNRIVMRCSVVQKLAHGNECHFSIPRKLITCSGQFM